MTQPTTNPGGWPPEPHTGHDAGATDGTAPEVLADTPVTTLPTTGDPGLDHIAPEPSDHGSSASTSETARQQAGEVRDTATSAAQDVAGSAKDQTRNVAGEVGQRGRDLLTRTGSELSDQAGRQQQRLADGLSDYTGQLRGLASGTEQPGPVSDLAHQAADRGERAADWLSRTEPRDVLHAVEDFARRRPGVFLAVAAGTGLLVGRFARGLFAESRGGDPALHDHTDDHTDARGDAPSRPSASLEEIPTSGTGAGPTVGDPLADESIDGAAAPFYGPADTLVPGPGAPGLPTAANTGEPRR